MPNGSLALNGSDASLANMQTYLDDFICDGNAQGEQYFWFQVRSLELRVPSKTADEII